MRGKRGPPPRRGRRGGGWKPPRRFGDQAAKEWWGEYRKAVKDCRASFWKWQRTKEKRIRLLLEAERREKALMRRNLLPKRRAEKQLEVNYLRDLMGLLSLDHYIARDHGNKNEAKGIARRLDRIGRRLQRLEEG